MSEPIVYFGRNASIMALVHHQLRSAGHAAEGFMEDAPLMARLEQGPTGLLILGGGVEEGPRQELRAFCASRGIRLLEHFGGPEQLLENVRAALATG
ncbi:MAG: hypothetical protein IPJ87_03975 [Flavobacteriales bacterium]|nr:hypothetical protein [Flavobacteriales bacterium]MBK7941023.1 hypothetical protein [Flavobacteriales bacterium]MBK8949693.1 hypothetical protein [Flavobacteriales bacterium]MBK9701553.1 hypothetical protein [Flavobacteriales bacterium]